MEENKENGSGRILYRRKWLGISPKDRLCERSEPQSYLAVPCHIVDEWQFFILQCLTLYIICIKYYSYGYNYKSVKLNTLNSIARGVKYEKSICLQQLCYR